ncbi:MAG: RNA-binding transcriptional accessory protein [Corynebacterium sp.]|uniref:Tex family protein n=1 Tax=Corynebacterium TaxID=1716 RepID=UPI0026499A03|nr:Tex family protein [Corynebacterium sp.]MDN5722762.1 RNA-binding transcriptional accessory protein [Corynebacterium sp.]MDN6283505.1 RNA-binding transcriptional accessory protein [Corynebacterium sp.]MDN6306504.1 RNA-binding transcriptional accessory protein [Corynebacterium sp.]MDN6368541.1 RNA-binding transcriptional accessory protein [Corynebacterium sp.]MDN6376234.1 RNA-binding transcriptional accessory protein [Corynebacterium sp.]
MSGSSVDTDLIRTLTRELGIGAEQVTATVRLLDEGNTVPFIARYRKEVTGGLDDSQLRTLETRLRYLRELAERKSSVLASIEEQGKLTDELRDLILGCETKARLEDLYLPFKSTRRTKATIAREAGLEPLVDTLLGDCTTDPAELAASYITEGFDDAKAVLAGARAIVLEGISTDADLVGEVRERFFTTGAMTAGVVEGKENSAEAQKYRDYFDFSEPFTTLPSHRILALLRGESEGVLQLTLDAGEDEIYQGMIAVARGLEPKGDAADTFRAECARFGWRTKLQVSSGVDVRMRLKERADEAAVDVFARNLHDLLLAAPAGQRATLGLDPGYRNGVKCAAVDPTGKVLDTVVIYPHQPQNQWDKSVDILARICAKNGVDLMAVGNGTASRETEKLAREISEKVSAATGQRPTPVIVSEAGASVYSASELAAEEFPDMDVSLRGAVSIARRLQDPLAELVKIDPKSIGVGQYQHDVNQAMLASGLDSVVEDAVNSVGVDVNTASVPLLRRVAGVSATLAENIVRHREDNGAFATRRQLKDVPRLGPKAFEQCAGFLRIQGGEDPLDASAVHPESYPLVRRITAAAGVPVADLVGNRRVLQGLNPRDFADDTFGVPTVTDVLAELDKPGRDPRPEFKTAALAEGINKVSDLTPGMVLEGTVTNVAAFGAFVDVGVHQDGLVHVSAMSDKFVSDPHDVVSSGQVVKVKVMEVDVERQRIGLSLRLNDEPGQGRSGSTGERGNGGREGSGRRGGNRNDGRGGNNGNRGGNRNGKPGGRNSGRDGGTNSGNNSGAAASGSMADALKRAGFGR